MAGLQPADFHFPTGGGVSRVDLHCHSHASQLARLGAQRVLGLPECATPPQEIYELAKRRGMDFVTITDHDTIDGVLEIADLPDVFIGEEVTARFEGEPRAAVHVLCWGFTPEDHEWLQAHASDVERCASYLHERDIACALAHPFFAVEASLAPRHRRRLADLFPVWEIRNGSRAAEVNLPAAIYIETRGGVGVGGSDDHAGVDIGRTFTETPLAQTSGEFLANLRAGSACPGGEHGSAPKLAHAALALGARVLGHETTESPDPRAVLHMVQCVMSEGEARRGEGTDLGPGDGRALLRAWFEALGLPVEGDQFLADLRRDGFSHRGLFCRARAAHEGALRRAVGKVATALTSGKSYSVAAPDLLEACITVVPYVTSAALLARDRAKLTPHGAEQPRVALVGDAIGSTHGVSRTVEEIRERGVPGFEVELIGTDARVDRRLSTVEELDIPFYPGLQVGVPSLPSLMDVLAAGRYELIHVCSPGPVGVAAAVVGRMLGTPILGSYHTELEAYARLRMGSARLAKDARAALAAFYRQCRLVLSPSLAADRSLRLLGVTREKIARWERGVDVEQFHPRKRAPKAFAGEIKVLYAGRLAREKGVELLADAFLTARRHDPRLHLMVAGGGPEECWLRDRVGEAATFLGWLEGEELAQAYASAEMFLFASRTDTFGQVVLEAQASALPVVAVAEGGPLDLVENGRTGLLRPPDPRALARALCGLAQRPGLRAELARGGLEASRTRSWERAMRQLAGGYEQALAGSSRVRRAA